MHLSLDPPRYSMWMLKVTLALMLISGRLTPTMKGVVGQIPPSKAHRLNADDYRISH